VRKEGEMQAADELKCPVLQIHDREASGGLFDFARQMMIMRTDK
jgi:hypothetical protein